jgi:hypothetical protein
MERISRSKTSGRRARHKNIARIDDDRARAWTIDKQGIVAAPEIRQSAPYRHAIRRT